MVGIWTSVTMAGLSLMLVKRFKADMLTSVVAEMLWLSSVLATLGRVSKLMTVVSVNCWINVLEFFIIGFGIVMVGLSGEMACTG